MFDDILGILGQQPGMQMAQSAVQNPFQPALSLDPFGGKAMPTDPFGGKANQQQGPQMFSQSQNMMMPMMPPIMMPY